MRVREEQSDELKGRVGGVSSLRGDTSVGDVAAAGFDTISNVVNISSLATRFARRRYTAVSLAASITLQLIFALVQHRNRKPKDLLLEIFFICTCLKAPWDAWKVAVGIMKQKGATVDSMTELSFDKCIELFAEGIPGVIIQASAIIADLGKGVSYTAVFSIVISAVTSGFTSSQISFDFDTDPAKRAENPDFYGYIPDGGGKRTLLFTAMTLNPAVMLLIKSMAVSLLGLTKALFLGLYFVVDIVLFLALKAARDDLIYWPPIGGWPGIIISFIIRIIGKLINDFTAIAQFRHPNEVGGAVWSFSVVVAVVMLFASLHVAKGKLGAAEMEMLWTTGFVLTGVAALTM